MTHENQNMEELFKEALDALNDGVAIYSAENKLVYSNQRYRDMNPVSAEVMFIGNHYHDILRHGAERGEYPDAVGRIDEFIEDVANGMFKNGEPYDLQRQNGTWYRVTNRRLSDGGFLASRVDISDLKRAEISALTHQKTQHELRSRFQYILNAITTHIVVLDADERCIFINSSAAEAIGCSTNDAEGLSIQQLYGKNAGKNLKRNIDNAARKPSPQTMTFHEKEKSYRETISFHQFCHDSITVVETADITSQQQAQDEIHSLQLQLTDALECMAEGFALFDQDKKLLLINRSMSLSMGCDPSIWWKGQSIEDVFRIYYSSSIPPLTPDVLEQKLLHSLARVDRSDGAPEEIQIPNGQWVVARDYRSSSGCYVCIRSNITTLKQANAILEKAQTAAEDASKMKSAFLTMMSHEIRTPLHGVLGNIELLDRENLSSNQRKRVVMLRRASEGLLYLLNDILDLSKIEANSLAIYEEPFQLDEIIERCAQTFSPTILAKELRFLCLIDPRIISSRLGDQQRISQILMNLLGNAAKFTETGAITLSATIHRSKGPDYVNISVADSGIGIAQQHQKRIFAPFSQVDASISRRFGGTGIGLFLCNRFATLMGGKINLESEVDVGSIFTLEVKLPVCNDEAISPVSATPFDIVVLRCNSPQWRLFLADQIRAWLPGCTLLNESEVITAPSSGILIVAEDVPASIPPRKATFATVETIVLSPDGPLEPERKNKCIHTTSLSASSFRAAIVMSGGRQKRTTVGKHVPAVRQGKRILIAEDDSINSMLLINQLETLGYDDVASVNNGEQALKQLATNSYDLIISDIGMPNIDGVQFLLKMREKGISTPTIIQTAGSEKEIPEIVNTLASRVLFKPVNLDQLKTAVNDALKISNHDNITQLKEKKNIELMHEMRKAYLDGWDEDRSRLIALLEAQDAKSFMNELHRLRGALLALKETKAASQCEELQHIVGKLAMDLSGLDLSLFWSSMDTLAQNLQAAVSAVRPE